MPLQVLKNLEITRMQKVAITKKVININFQTYSGIDFAQVFQRQIGY